MAFLEPDQQTCWILKVRDDVDEAHAPAGLHETRVDLVERPEVDAVLLLRHALHVRPHVAERGDGAGVSGQLHEHDVAGIEQHARHEIQPLLRPRRYEQAIEPRRHTATVHDPGDQIEQRAKPTRGTVLQHAAVRTREELARDVGEICPGKRVRRRVPGRERDDVAILREDRAHTPNRGFPHRGACLREIVVVIHHAKRGPLTSVAVSWTRNVARLCR